VIAATLLSLALCAVPTRDGDVADIARRIAKERDKVDPALFDALAEIGGTAAFEALCAGLERVKRDELRAALLGAIGRFGADPELRGRAIVVLADSAVAGTGAAPAAAAGALAKVDPPAAELAGVLAALERVAREAEDPSARRTACDPLVAFLGKRGGADDKRLILAASAPRYETDQTYLGISAREAEILAGWTHYAVVRRALASGDGPESRAPLVEKLRDPGAARAWRLLVLDVLAEREGADVDAAIAGALQDADAAVVLGALEALATVQRRGGEWDDQQRLLRPLMKHPDVAVRRAAVVQMGRFGLTDAAWRDEAVALARSPDASLRMGAAAALAEIRTPEAMTALHGLLEDGLWSVRVEALEQVAKLRRIESVPVLIARMEAEVGRFRDDAYAALRMLTGLDHGSSPERWKRWWEAEGAAFQVPDHARALRAEQERRARESTDEAGGGTRAAHYFGVHVTSRRQVFVLDVSGSMRLPSGAAPKDAGAAELTQTTRMDVAKRELMNVLRNLPDDTLFNVVFFESVVTSLENKLVRMKKATRQKALRFVAEQYAVGSTALYPALELAFADPLVDTIYLLSDGAPTEGAITDITEIRAEVRRWNSARHVRIHGISMGQDSTLLKWLCADTGGRYLRVD
jgi:hypothetical protein